MYYSYSEFLKNKYGEKVYKLPINLPVSCPNRQNKMGGCDFCAEQGTGFEARSEYMPVAEQIEQNRALIEKKYHAHKFIAYYQNYTNTFLPVSQFETYVREGASCPDIMEVSVSTRPDCIRTEYLEVLKHVKEEYGTEITVELGLQTVNYHTLAKIHRGHSLAEFIDAVLMIQIMDSISVCTLS